MLLIICRAAVWGRLRSPNYNNNNNFSAVGSGAGGGVNNYNANNSGGLEKYFPGWESLKLPSDAFTRTLLAWREIVPALVSCVKATQI